MGENARFEKIFNAVINAIQNSSSVNGSPYRDIVLNIKKRIMKSGKKPKSNFTYVIRLALKLAAAENLLNYYRGRYTIPYKSVNPIENKHTGLSCPMDYNEGLPRSPGHAIMDLRHRHRQRRQGKKSKFNLPQRGRGIKRTRRRKRR